jgi:hypothetical protein
MALQKGYKRKTRMYEPWGYREEDNYISNASRVFQDLEEFFSGAKYNKGDNKIHFYNHNGEELKDSAIDVAEFEQETIIEEAYYDKSTQEIVILFTNGDEVRISVKDLIDINEFADGLQVNDGVVSLKLVNGDGTEKYLSVDENGLSAHLLDVVIQDIYDRIAAEIARATSEEQRIEAKLDQEIERAISAETKIAQDLATETTRATRTEQVLNSRVDTLNDELDAEESIREANDAALGLRITTETNDRISAVTAEKERAEAVEQALQDAIDAEVDRATSADTELNNAITDEVSRAMAAEQALDERIDEIISGSPIEGLDELIEKLGYKDNDTLERTNEHEVAFGEYNVSNTDVEPSGQTIFSVGIGTSENDRKNALEVRKDGSVYMWIEGGYVQINNLLAQLTNEVYDTNP